MIQSATSSKRSAYDYALVNLLFDDARRAARWHRRWSRLAGVADRLQTLAEVRGTRRIGTIHFAGTRSVPIAQIRGSENARAGFDGGFRPLDDRLRERWVSVAHAFAEGTPLPPVELIQLGDSYFVRDGHHRISVARALRQELIDAIVTVLEVSALPVTVPGPVTFSPCARREMC